MCSAHALWDVPHQPSLHTASLQWLHRHLASRPHAPSATTARPPRPPRFPEQVTLLISSCTSAVVYAVNGSIPWAYGAVRIVAGFLATLLGQTIISWLVRRLGRPSILVITLAVMFAASAGVAAAVVALTALDLARHPAKLAATKGVCPTFN